MTEMPVTTGAVHSPVQHPVSPVAAWLPAPNAGHRLARRFGYLLAGLPILVGTLLASRGLATVERRAVCWATGRELPPHHYRPARGHRVARRLVLALADPQSWRDLLHCVVAFPVRVATFAIAVTWAVGGLGSTLYLLWEWSLPRSDSDYHGLFGLITGSSSRLDDIATHTAIGVLMLLSLPWVVRGLVAAQAGLARGLLTNQTAALRARAEQLDAGRRAAGGGTG